MEAANSVSDAPHPDPRRPSLCLSSIFYLCTMRSASGDWSLVVSARVALSTYFATDSSCCSDKSNRYTGITELGASGQWSMRADSAGLATVPILPHLISSRLLASARNLPGSNYHTRDAGPAGPAEGLDLNEWTTPFGRLELIRLAEQRSRGEHPWRLHVEYRQDDGLAIRRARSQNWPPTGARRWRS